MMAALWNQMEALRKNSWQVNVQKCAINTDHAYSKSKGERPKPSEHLVQEDEIDDLKPVETVIHESNDIIYDEQEIEVSETADLLIEVNPQDGTPPKAIPVIKTAPSSSGRLPIRIDVNPNTKKKKGKCIVLQESLSDAVDVEKLGPLFDLECHQVESLKIATSRKNLHWLSNTIMQAKPEVILIHLGKTDLRQQSASVPAVIKNYNTLLSALSKVTEANICATVLKQTYGFTRFNNLIKEFNSGVAQMVKRLQASSSSGHQFFVEEEEYVTNGIGSKSEIVEEFRYVHPPDEQEFHTYTANYPHRAPNAPNSTAKLRDDLQKQHTNVKVKEMMQKTPTAVDSGMTTFEASHLHPTRRKNMMQAQRIKVLTRHHSNGSNAKQFESSASNPSQSNKGYETKPSTNRQNESVAN
jgi:hypothetical protein